LSCTAHLPVNRGFTSSFGYLSGADRDKSDPHFGKTDTEPDRNPGMKWSRAVLRGAEDHFADTRSGYVDLWRSR
jgi:hypothetical protein